MIRLDTATRKLQAVLSAAVATSQCSVVVSYVDKSSAAPVGAQQLTYTNGATAVDICAAPAGFAVREIDQVSIYNADTATVNVTIRYNDNATIYQIVRATLLTLEQLTYVEGAGWKTLDANGNVKQLSTAANLTGPITSVGAATAIASQTGTGTTFAMSTAPALTNATLIGGTVDNVVIGATTPVAGKFTSLTATGTLSTSGYTVATLPAGTVGMRAYVTDATAPTYLSALTGGGAVKCPVFYNGTAWVSA